MPKNTEQSELMMIPGMEELFESVAPKNDSSEEFFEGKPRGENRYFDASALPDAPGYQDSADGANIFMMYITFPTKNDFDRGVQALTFGQRKLSEKTVKIVTIDSVHPGKNNKSFLKMWEDVFYERQTTTKGEMSELIQDIYIHLGDDIEEYNTKLGVRLKEIAEKLRKEDLENGIE